MLKVWGRRSAFNVQKVMWLIGELGLAHEHTTLGGDAGGLDDPDFLKMNPHGRVPVIDDNGTIVWESHAILRYLAAVYGDAALWPDDPAVRSEADRWMDWAQSSLQPTFLNGIFWGYFRTPEAERDWPTIREKQELTNQYFKRLDEALKGRDYLGGACLGLGDIPAGTHLYRYFGMDLDRPALPHVEAWFERLQERPAYREHVMIPFQNLKGKTSY
ncbi:MAG: glutathione S-transferase [Nisaea sp.]|uniref:glutathione S-transferase family protein n=1 Tax=Nisaea sp. TaxID=2024842 RepID=UPI001B296BB1|nr:glutathione S-transferase [Nisaea sp.]MBO6559014.1 glutathione S-transferase [Nisaea sp.]